MILKNEIQKRAEEWKVPSETVEKDWILGHFLSALFSFVKHRGGLVFKGGTALRKCYFKDYRFSEDLDFTVIDKNYRLIKADVELIIKSAQANSGIRFYLDSFKELFFENKPTGYQVKIKYWGANHQKNQAPPEPERWNTQIKLEIISYEKVIFPVSEKKISHPYSDILLNGSEPVPCYDLKEVMAEKLRALMQRSYSAPRDYYDIYMIKSNFNEAEWKEIKNAFIQKMEFKGLKFTGSDDLINDKTFKAAKTAWNNSLKHQIAKEDLPDFDFVISEIKPILKKYLDD